MHNSTKKWLFTKISSFILIPFMIWFIMNFVSIYENDYQEVVLKKIPSPPKGKKIKDLEIVISLQKK